MPSRFAQYLFYCVGDAEKSASLFFMLFYIVPKNTSNVNLKMKQQEAF